jgi:hypothetical protein
MIVHMQLSLLSNSTAEIQGYLKVNTLPARWPIYTYQGMLSLEPKSQGSPGFRYNLLNQRWSGPQMTRPLGTVAYSRLPAGRK